MSGTFGTFGVPRPAERNQSAGSMAQYDNHRLQNVPNGTRAHGKRFNKSLSFLFFTRTRVTFGTFARRSHFDELAQQ